MARKFLDGIDVASQKIVHVADGSAADDVASWGQVQNFVNGLAWKQEVRAATTAAGTLASSFANGSSVDGVTLATGDRILIKNQATGSENGIYTVAASGAPTRAVDATSSTQLNNATVLVLSGTANADTAWTQTAANPTVGTTALTFVQFGAGGTTYSAGNGLQLVGSTFSVKLPASSGLVADGTGTYIDTTIVTRKFSVSVGDGTSTTITVTHNLGTKDVQVTLYDNSTFNEVSTDVNHATTNTVTLTFATAPTTNAYRCVVTG